MLIYMYTQKVVNISALEIIIINTIVAREKLAYTCASFCTLKMSLQKSYRLFFNTISVYTIRLYLPTDNLTRNMIFLKKKTKQMLFLIIMVYSYSS